MNIMTIEKGLNCDIIKLQIKENRRSYKNVLQSHKSGVKRNTKAY